MARDTTDRRVEERQPLSGRAQNVVVKDGLAHIEINYFDVYEPSEYPNLPTTFMKVSAGKELERFLREFGPLGWWELLDPEDQKRWPKSSNREYIIVREPVDWIIAQAQTVGFALELIEALQADDEDRLSRVLLRRRLSVSTPETISIGDPSPTPDSYATYYVAKAGGYGGRGGRLLKNGGEYLGGWYTTGFYSLGQGPRSLRAHASEIIVDLINANTAGVRETVRFDFASDAFGLQVTSRGLIEMIWLHVRNTALGGRLRRCDDCGTPFVVTDQRQRFCPPDLPGGKSRCAARSLKRRQRSR